MTVSRNMTLMMLFILHHNYNEEIPTGLYLLRMIPRAAFQQKFAGKSYRKFLLSCGIRICMGYLFLLNVLIVIFQSTGVIEIFYDVLALQ